MDDLLPAKVEFGAQLRKYREKVELTQDEFAELHNTGGSFINLVENGKTAVSIDLLEAYASTFGVRYYQMGNPKFRLPSLNKMPDELHKYLKKVKRKRKDRRNQPRQPLADYLDKIIVTDYLKTPRTGAMIAAKIKEAYDVGTTSGKVTALLTRHPRNQQVKRVDRPEGAKGGGNWYQLI